MLVGLGLRAGLRGYVGGAGEHRHAGARRHFDGAGRLGARLQQWMGLVERAGDQAVGQRDRGWHGLGRRLPRRSQRLERRRGGVAGAPSLAAGQSEQPGAHHRQPRIGQMG